MKFTADFTKNGYRLPTEAEWEFAARAGTTSKYYFDSLNINSYAWFNGNISSTSHLVAQKLPNAYGLYDMSGNVWEWCYDKYGVYNLNSQIDPTGPSSGTARVLRSGAWNGNAMAIFFANRSNSAPQNNFNYVGFRTVSLHPMIHE